MSEVHPPTVVRSDGHGPPGACLSDELVLGYLSGELSAAEHGAVDAHLTGCDRCVELLPIVQRRLLAGAQRLMPVPQAVRAAVQATANDTPRARAELRAAERAHAPQPRRNAWRDRLTEWRGWWWIYPTLVPAAVALTALLVLAPRSWLTPSARPGKTRAVQVHDVLPVTVASAQVWPQPAARAPLTALLPRGTRVEIVGEDGGWFHVVLADGRAGWIERRAFE